VARPDGVSGNRRRFLRLLAASPVLGCVDLPRSWMTLLAQEPEPISAAKDALNVFDFEAVARKKLPPAHFGYMASGGDDDATIQANRDGFSRYQLRVRRLVDVSRIDMSVGVFGTTWSNPILLCPIGGQKMFHPEGELAVARAAKSKKHVQVLSTVGTASVEEVTAARGEPIWFQLYQRDDWDLTRQIVNRAEAAGCPALVFTIDLLGGRNPETYQRAQRRDTRQCSACHNPAPLVDNRRRPMLADLVAAATPRPEVGAPTWDYVKRLKDATGMKLLLKGIVTREDAELAMQNGVDGVIVSNHGGRAENSLRSTIECVPDVVAGVAGRAPVIVDSGFRRGTDIFKALALGATAVGVGRPYVWGLSAFGQEGVEAVLDILQRELQLVMRQAGTTSISKITHPYVVDRKTP
jgi:4-hydroxymandelate oxidase